MVYAAGFDPLLTASFSEVVHFLCIRSFFTISFSFALPKSFLSPNQLFGWVSGFVFVWDWVWFWFFLWGWFVCLVVLFDFFSFVPKLFHYQKRREKGESVCYINTGLTSGFISLLQESLLNPGLLSSLSSYNASVKSTVVCDTAL